MQHPSWGKMGVCLVFICPVKSFGVNIELEICGLLFNSFYGYCTQFTQCSWNFKISKQSFIYFMLHFCTCLFKECWNTLQTQNDNQSASLQASFYILCAKFRCTKISLLSQIIKQLFDWKKIKDKILRRQMTSDLRRLVLKCE